jgi:DNA-binding transcriptional regulator YhcF (GntR family)
MTELRLRLDATSQVAPYLQIREGIRDRILDGRLPVGARLPAVRALAEELKVAAGTVARAYKELESDELLQTNGRHGTTVAPSGDAVAHQTVAAAQQFAARIVELRADPVAALAAARTALGLSRLGG